MLEKINQISSNIGGWLIYRIFVKFMIEKNKRSNVKVQITVPKSILEQVDKLSGKLFMSRTQWFLQLAIEELRKNSTEEKKIIEID